MFIKYLDISKFIDKMFLESYVNNQVWIQVDKGFLHITHCACESLPLLKIIPES